MTSTYAVIMAGGVGSRFWPASRRLRPKQLLPLADDNTSLIRATVERISPVVPAERVIIVTSDGLCEATAAELPDVPRENILGEPTGRNTAPCVGWAAAHVRRRDPDATMMVLPADHHIGDVPAYLDVLRRCIGAAGEGALVTVGLVPTRPETGYGYIEPGDARGEGVFATKRFVEKPDAERAARFVDSGYLWNSGMFFFQAASVLAEFNRQRPAMYAMLERYDEAAATGDEAELVARTYGDIESISFDHGVMEDADNVWVVPGSFGWSDLGSWTTAYELADKDADGNALPREGDDSADAIVIDSTGSYISAGAGKLVALVGMRDVVVVDTDDALLVMPRERAQDVKRVVAALKEQDDPRR